MWNDADIPLAYLITFRCYGTWLHGDERGSVNRFNNQYKTSYLPPQKKWIEINRQRLKGDAVTLNAPQRSCVEKAIRDTCLIRQWRLNAINVRTNHVHTVVSIGLIKPEKALNAFKANSTREMRQNDFWKYQHSPWADKGSKRYLWNERSVEMAVDYVINGQGDELPEF
jgi:REP element-mobilizing transposase RayT